MGRGSGGVRAVIPPCVTHRPAVRSGSIMEPNQMGNPERHPHGEVRSEVVDEHILVMTVDRVEKKNAFTPKISTELGQALTRLDEDPDLFVGVLTFAGEHT